uniref:Putative secreted protein n=1 Tax=Ixodes ricinus TaxID=34613 RepID=A0A6B0UA92_IXORI
MQLHLIEFFHIFFFLIVETAIPFLQRPPVERCATTDFSQRFSWHWLRKHSDLGRCYIGTVNTFFFRAAILQRLDCLEDENKKKKKKKDG